MSQSRSSLQEKLRRKLEEVKSEEPGTDWLRDLVEWLYQEMLEMEFSAQLGADPYERTPNRQGYRNGYRERQLHTRVGTLTLRVPRDREGKFSTRLFERCQRSEKALILALQEAYVAGVSTRKVSWITEKLCGTEFSKNQVSRMAQRLDEELDRWRGRRLGKPVSVPGDRRALRTRTRGWAGDERGCADRGRDQRAGVSRGDWNFDGAW